MSAGKENASVGKACFGRHFVKDGETDFMWTITVHVMRYNMDKIFREFIDFINLRDT